MVCNTGKGLGLHLPLLQPFFSVKRCPYLSKEIIILLKMAGEWISQDITPKAVQRMGS